MIKAKYSKILVTSLIAHNITSSPPQLISPDVQKKKDNAVDKLPGIKALTSLHFC